MKKRLLSFLIAVILTLPLMLTACGDDDSDSQTARDTLKPMTITLYGITGDSTTEEAIRAVEEELNIYTEGQFNTHLVLRLYPADEYDQVIRDRFNEIERQSQEQGAEKEKLKILKKLLKLMGQTTSTLMGEEETEAEETEAPEVDEETGVSKYPEATEDQIDIFMVQGSALMEVYAREGHLASLNEAYSNSHKILSTYLSKQILSTVTLDGTSSWDGLITKGKIYGVPNNTVCGEYTYLLINKELATQYYYSPADIYTDGATDPLAGLANFLEDAATHEDYITLYNEPVMMVDYFTDTFSLIGGMVNNGTNALTNLTPSSLIGNETYVNFLSRLRDFRAAGYIEDGDYYSLDSESKVAAAFVKGDASLKAKYEAEGYYVINYANPYATAEDRPGTMFCVSAHTKNVSRCMDIVTALQTNVAFRNTFQYGVDTLHYIEDEYTGEITVLRDDYVMDPADTGNLFILKPNAAWDDSLKALAANNWALGKQQNRDTIISPYAIFPFRVITANNYKDFSKTWNSMFDEAFNAAKKLDKTLEKSKFVFNEPYSYQYTDVILRNLAEVAQTYLEQIESFEEYVNDKGELVTFEDFMADLNVKFTREKAYRDFCDLTNPESPLSQYNSWYSAVGPK